MRHPFAAGCAPDAAIRPRRNAAPDARSWYFEYLTVQFLKINTTQTAFIYIGEKYTAVQHLAVRIGDRVFDSYTGSQGMLYSQYLTMLGESNLGPSSVGIEVLKTISRYR